MCQLAYWMDVPDDGRMAIEACCVNLVYSDSLNC
jgi:hypothetical protein